jgi:transposase
MKKGTQFHKLPREVRRDRREQAFKLLESGYTKSEVAKLVEVNIVTVYGWINKKSALKKNKYHGQKRGNPNDRKYLNKKQENEIVNAIKTATPQDYGVHSHLWSRRAIAEVISKKYKISLIPQRVSRYTKRWGLSPQRPSKQAYEQDDKKIEKWLKIEYPKIHKRAVKEGALIHWGDETSINLNTNYQRTYAPKGKTPKLKILAKKTSYSMVSSISNQGQLRYMVYKGAMNTKRFKVFLTRLIKDVDRKIFLILDNLKVHHAKIIQKWEKKNNDKIEIFFPTPICSTIQS